MLVGSFEKYYHLHEGADYSFDGHRHNSFEVNAVLDGSLEVTYGDDVFTLASGDFFIGAPGNISPKPYARKRSEQFHFPALSVGRG